ncbi:hypothetical protein N6H05_08660 [Sphingobium sp. WTD-1]|uniref:hypothetical protein n=1 Tax=Sphingobium sp. WTD-1 TaxID=2979467 RepID=UPI0024DE8AEC|nr:hypothetical protein [Sphingobium sp. WTD-1]WIA57848.1 hypothetical protein N6H05_08660 [Sphingobium sp. WTD-1]
MDKAFSASTELHALASALGETEVRVATAVTVCAATVSELKRLHHAAGKRRGGPASADARKYVLGSTLVLAGVGDLDDTALVGLFAHPEHMQRWMRQALNAGAGPQLGDLIRWMFEEPRRLEWCRQWGRILQWRNRQALYVAEVQSFRESGRTGPKEPWRRKPVTIGQEALIAALVELLGEPAPRLSTRGEAFDWISARGGNPIYWREPMLPPNLEEDHE